MECIHPVARGRGRQGQQLLLRGGETGRRLRTRLRLARADPALSSKQQQNTALYVSSPPTGSRSRWWTGGRPPRAGRRHLLPLCIEHASLHVCATSSTSMAGCGCGSQSSIEYPEVFSAGCTGDNSVIRSSGEPHQGTGEHGG